MTTDEQKRKCQMIKFRANGKIYPHYKRHKANVRQVKRDEWIKHFEQRHNRKITRDEIETFKQAFNIGWELSKEHYKKIKLTSEESK